MTINRRRYIEKVSNIPGLVLCLIADASPNSRTWCDLSGKNNHGKVIGAQLVGGKYGQAYKFDGVDDIVDYGASGLNGFPSGNDPRTVEVWAMLTDMPSRSYRMVSFGNNARYEGCFLGFSRDYLYVWGFWNYDLNYTTDLTQFLNKWVFWVGTYDGMTARSYINGVEVASGNYPNVNTVLVKGFVGDQLSQYEKFPGLISEVRIFNRALSSEEIHWLYELGRQFYPEV